MNGLRCEIGEWEDRVGRAVYDNLTNSPLRVSVRGSTKWNR